MILMQVHEESDQFDIVLKSQVADVVVLFLPGVISGLIEVCVKSDVQNHKITMVGNFIKESNIILNAFPFFSLALERGVKF